MRDYLLKFAFLAAVAAADVSGQVMDLAPFARPCCRQDQIGTQTFFDYSHPSGLQPRPDGKWVLGFQWAEERDVREIVLRSASAEPARQVSLQYWSWTWPQTPPSFPNTEDPADDPWQGSWLTAQAKVSCEGSECRINFDPLADSENPRAKNLPGVDYRRTMKVRLLFPAGPKPDVSNVRVFSGTKVRPVKIRLHFDGGSSATPKFEAYNGAVRDSARSKGDWTLTVDAAEPSLPGSNDTTVIQVRRGADAFSFNPLDVEKGPVYIPHVHTMIVAGDAPLPSPESLVQKGAKIRDRLAREREQTYERASRDIPPLDPVVRQGGRLYLPLTADASWQKFALEWGGNVSISKRGVKAKPRELPLLSWPDDRISWRIGTGETPVFRDAAKDSSLSTLDDELPIALARWSSGSFEFEEEAFGTLLSGPLSPEDPSRDENVPAVLSMRIKVKNTAQADTAHLWVAMRPGEPLEFSNSLLTAGGGKSTRARINVPQGASTGIETCRDDGQETPALHIRVPMQQGGESEMVVMIPFLPGLSSAQRDRLSKLSYPDEKERILQYWRQVVAHGSPFEVPEKRFNSFSRGLISRIRISATHDPKSGLYMLPAASWTYDVFADESIFQIRLLDSFGHHDLAGKYLETFVKLQGSKPFDGAYTEQSAVYHGAKVDPEWDYTSSQYNRDHGLVLATLARHYLLSRDRAWLERVLPGMKKAGDWIAGQRKLTKKTIGGEPVPEYGLLPAGHLSDNQDWGHWFGVNGHASEGLTSLADVLKDIGDSEASKYQKEAAGYRSELRTAVLRAAAAAPVIKLRDNTWVPYIPTRPYQRIRAWGPRLVKYYSRYAEKRLPTFRLAADREVLTGPRLLLETGVFGPNEPITQWLLDDWEDNATMSTTLGINPHGWVDEEYWFSRGGLVFQANLYNPTRTYLQRGEVPAAVREMYNAFVACYYPAVNVFTEEFRQWESPSGPFFKIPDEAQFVDRLRDLLVSEIGDDLHLAAGTPRRWLADGQKISVKAAPTFYGPVSFELSGSADEVRGSIELPSRNPYHDAWITVRAPEGKRVDRVELNGSATQFDAATGKIRLPKGVKTISLSAHLSADAGTR